METVVGFVFENHIRTGFHQSINRLQNIFYSTLLKDGLDRLIPAFTFVYIYSAQTTLLKPSSFSGVPVLPIRRFATRSPNLPVDGSRVKMATFEVV
jgi:hypothetical protein